MRKLILFAAIALGACSPTRAPDPAATAAASEPKVWIRSDGRRASESPALVRQFTADKSACVGNATTVSDAAEDCMRGKGYIYVPQSQAPQIAAQLAAGRG